MAEKVISDLFLHTVFSKACTKSEKIKRQEEHYFRKILENETDETVHKAFKEVFTEDHWKESSDRCQYKHIRRKNSVMCKRGRKRKTRGG